MRVRGTQRVILLIVLVYDIYIYKSLVDQGLGWFVAIVVLGGIVAGTIAGGVLQRSPQLLEKVTNFAGLSAMGVFLVSQCFQFRFPLWVYFVAHILIWFWFTALFWYESRPFDYDFLMETGTDEEDEFA